jgi:hypothetical protein
MKNIINDRGYSRGYKYSLHALIDMSIKYFSIVDENISRDDIQYMQEKILCLPKHEMDTYILSGIEKYMRYCKDHGYGKYCEPIILENISHIQNALEEDYLVENLDW